MQSLPFTSIRKYVLLIALVLFSGGIGYRLGQQGVTVNISRGDKIIINKEQPSSSSVDFSLFWDVWQRLYRSYIDKSSLDSEKLVEGAIVGMVNAVGDPYTAYLPPKENKEFKEDLGGQFEGIGAQLGLKDNRIIVVAPLKGMPSEKAGILPGDYILKVNDEETIGWTVPQAVTKIRGPRNTSVQLQILHERDQKPVDISIVRDTIVVPSVELWVKSPGVIEEISGIDSIEDLQQRQEKIAYLSLSRFGDRTNDEWGKAVSDLLSIQKANGGLKGLIFDLRNNPGGYLDGSVFIASEFLKDGIVVSQVNSDGSRDDYNVNRKGRLLTIPMVVLINKGSASASEIVAGALRDYKRATVVGEESFGKGSVQTPQELTGGGSLHVTTGKWLLPNGDSIHKKGITPDYLEPMEQIEASRDAQLAKAIELLLK